MTDILVLWAPGIVAVIAIVGALWRWIGRPLAGLVVRLDRFWDDWSGEPARPGVPERPGVMMRLERIEARQAATDERAAATEASVEEIKHELRPNSGRSLRDVADRIEQAVTPPN